MRSKLKYNTEEERKAAKQLSYKKWYAINEVKEKARLAKYRKDNNQKINEYKKKWREDNPDIDKKDKLGFY